MSTHDPDNMPEPRMSGGFCEEIQRYLNDTHALIDRETRHARASNTVGSDGHELTDRLNDQVSVDRRALIARIGPLAARLDRVLTESERALKQKKLLQERHHEIKDFFVKEKMQKAVNIQEDQCKLLNQLYGDVLSMIQSVAAALNRGDPSHIRLVDTFATPKHEDKGLYDMLGLHSPD